jgi:hypothetical protein
VTVRPAVAAARKQADDAVALDADAETVTLDFVKPP